MRGKKGVSWEKRKRVSEGKKEGNEGRKEGKISVGKCEMSESGKKWCSE